MNKIIVGQFKINSHKNEFNFLAHQGKGNIDIFIISETKLGKGFPAGQCLMNAYIVPFVLTNIETGVVYLLYIRRYTI